VRRFPLPSPGINKHQLTRVLEKVCGLLLRARRAVRACWWSVKVTNPNPLDLNPSGVTIFLSRMTRASVTLAPGPPLLTKSERSCLSENFSGRLWMQSRLSEMKLFKSFSICRLWWWRVARRVTSAEDIPSAAVVPGRITTDFKMAISHCTKFLHLV